MKILVEIELQPNGEKPLKGEELREVVCELLTEAHIDGWELKRADVKESKADSKVDALADYLAEMAKVAFQSPDAQSVINPAHTNRVMVEYWLSESKRIAGRK